ncbi:MAG: hypothetical protein GW762_06045 [Candidatus Pacebacteria bacterium]|nr:hypothetical protein [Candidatus Paceibacterota bacterium]PIR64098.1 MAG: hypothetical protein COU64_00950 [Candidatus Pacebacteria bacterium CG10_big_fil_rev_8_21_14_0_10_40_26]PIY79564.1 MAG: hypothetical protein COY81_01920 [Candidatus Pacebacteria bacterium CG_4_10_14_0_8_um_filter_43_12]PIZ78450.1 MAG: hypothetical protein COY01_04330 [Candidatus Pacebacteria bacterium CG_4_10_14_0_2_um_filter_40_20]PJA69300.1 MAG: hypothetical protein CO156_00215 [Candidatus Pacebacteria bacterium CG_4
MNNGFIAISTTLVITTLLLVVGLSVSLVSLNYLQTSFSHGQSKEVFYLAESCAEDALLSLNTNGTLPPSVTLPEGNCSITIDTQSGSEISFTVTAIRDSYTHRIQIATNRSTTVIIQSWQHLP